MQDCGVGKDDLTQIELQICVDFVNTVVQEEHDCKLADQSMAPVSDFISMLLYFSFLQVSPPKISVCETELGNDFCDVKPFVL